jgi:hypothetical protein
MAVIKIKRGSDRTINVRVKDNSGEPIPLTGMSVNFKCREANSDTELFNMTNTSADHADALLGASNFIITRVMTAAAKKSNYLWELSVYNESTGYKSIMNETGILIISNSL